MKLQDKFENRCLVYIYEKESKFWVALQAVNFLNVSCGVLKDLYTLQ